MKTLRIILIIALLSPVFKGCEELLSTTDALTETEIIEGLKTALLVGTDSSVAMTSRANGYFKDEAIKILLPPEAEVIYKYRENTLLKTIGVDKMLDDAILALNMAAEDAAKEAGPIFTTAITDLSISEGLAILQGTNPAASKKTSDFDSTAATGYLRSTTYIQLSDAFSPKINTSLGKKLVGELSPNQIWNTLTTSYNTVADLPFSPLEPIENTDLGVYVTEKALDGLFLKVAVQEKEIRRDPLKWASTAVGNILERVFGPSEK